SSVRRPPPRTGSRDRTMRYTPYGNSYETRWITGGADRRRANDHRRRHRAAACNSNRSCWSKPGRAGTPDRRTRGDGSPGTRESAENTREDRETYLRLLRLATAGASILPRLRRYAARTGPVRAGSDPCHPEPAIRAAQERPIRGDGLTSRGHYPIRTASSLPARRRPDAPW